MADKEALLSRNPGYVLAKCKPIGWKSVYGWSSRYDDEYPTSLLGIGKLMSFGVPIPCHRRKFISSQIRICYVY